MNNQHGSLHMADEKSKEVPAAEKHIPVSDEELRASFAGPAFHSNKMFLTMTAAGARIAFMEQVGDKVPPVYRTAVLLSYLDAVSLRDLITRQLKNIEAAFKPAEPAATPAEPAATKQDGE